jgi:hypothetical protein
VTQSQSDLQPCWRRSPQRSAPRERKGAIALRYFLLFLAFLGGPYFLPPVTIGEAL